MHICKNCKASCVCEDGDEDVDLCCCACEDFPSDEDSGYEDEDDE